jgi:hypothetical protein
MRRGFRRDVAELVAVLDEAVLYIALRQPIDGIEVGQVVDAADADVNVSPHLLANEQGIGVVPLFSDPDILRSVGQHAHWTTGDSDDLDFCTLPARAALDLALQLVDGERIGAAVINPADEFELLLQRHELGAIVQGKAIPLVGYVSAIAVDPSEAVLKAEPLGAVDPRLSAAIAATIKDVVGVMGYRIEQSFNPERDLEPHPVLLLEISTEADFDRDELGQRVFAAIDGLLPEPGYIDVLFESHSEPN